MLTKSINKKPCENYLFSRFREKYQGAKLNDFELQYCILEGNAKITITEGNLQKHFWQWFKRGHILWF
jgi:hypothetical protein